MSEREVLGMLGLTALLGSQLRYWLPDLDIPDLRQKLNRLVLAVFLPALTFKVIYTTEITGVFWQVPLLAMMGVMLSTAAGMLIYGLLPLEHRAQSALILAGAFGNVTYLGLPVLQGLFPTEVLQVTTVAILYEMTITPVNLLCGAALASRYAAVTPAGRADVLRSIVKLPLLWAIVVALLLNFLRIPVPAFVLGAAAQLGNAVTALMILSLGMALRIEALRARRRQLGVLVPCVMIKLALSPLVVWLGARLLGVPEPFASATVTEAAMPTQMMVLAVADRFGLDTELAALAALVSTAASFLTLLVVRHLLAGSG